MPPAFDLTLSGNMKRGLREGAFVPRIPPKPGETLVSLDHGMPKGCGRVSYSYQAWGLTPG